MSPRIETKEEIARARAAGMAMTKALRVEREHRELLSACKVWRQATESRLRLVSNREMSDVLLAPDRALFEAIDKAEETHAV